MLEKKQIQAIFYSSSKWIVKQQRQCTTSTMHLAQELLMNVQCSHGSKRFVKERRALTVRLAIGSWQRQLRAIIETWSSSTTREIAKEVNISHSTVIWHLKQIGKVNKWQVGDSWTDHKSKKKKQNIVLKCLRLLFQTTMNHFLIRLWHAVKSGFYTTTGDDQLSDWTKKNLQNTSQSEICTNKRSSSLFGGLPPVWSTTAFWIPVKLLHLRRLLSKSKRCTENCKPTPDIDQQKGPNSSAWQRPTHAFNCF